MKIALCSFLYLLLSFGQVANANSETIVLHKQLYQMTQLSIPERAQESFVSKVKNLLNTPNLDSESLALVNIMTADRHVQDSDVVTARRYLNIALPLVEEVNSTKLRQEYEYIEMYVARDEGKLDRAKEIAIKLHDANQDIWSKTKLSELVLEHIYIDTLRSNYEEAINLMETALNHAIESKDPYQLVGTYNVFGILHTRLEDSQSAIGSFRKAVDVMEENPDFVKNIYIYSNLADVLRRNGDYKEAQEFLDKTFSLAESKKDLSAKAFAFQIQSRLREDQELYELALQSLEQAFALNQKIGEDLFASLLHFEFANIYLKMQLVDKADEHLKLAAVLPEVGSERQIEIKEIQAKIAFERKEYLSAYTLLKESYADYKESINQQVMHISTLASRNLEKEHLSYQNQLLEKENALTAENLEQEKNFNNIMLMLLMVLILVLIVLFWMTMRYRKLAAESNKTALTDGLTQLPSRRQMFRKLEDHHKRSDKTNSSYSIILLDIDHFKNINDRFGHAIGDRVIQVTRDICQTLLRDDDTIGRIAGEEFLIILPSTDLDQALVVAQRITDSFATYAFDNISNGLRVTASFGVTEYMVEDEHLDHVINRADRLLHRAKQNGRNQICSSLSATEQS